eukprot:PhM_4_TR3481/c0_g1_i1/m.14743
MRQGVEVQLFVVLPPHAVEGIERQLLLRALRWPVLVEPGLEEAVEVVEEARVGVAHHRGVLTLEAIAQQNAVAGTPLVVVEGTVLIFLEQLGKHIETGPQHHEGRLEVVRPWRADCFDAIRSFVVGERAVPRRVGVLSADKIRVHENDGIVLCQVEEVHLVEGEGVVAARAQHSQRRHHLYVVEARGSKQIQHFCPELLVHQCNNVDITALHHRGALPQCVRQHKGAVDVAVVGHHRHEGSAGTWVRRVPNNLAQFPRHELVHRSLFLSVDVRVVACLCVLADNAGQCIGIGGCRWRQRLRLGVSHDKLSQR